MVRVACSNGDRAPLELARITSGASATNSAAYLRIGVSFAIAKVNADILPDGPTQLLQGLRESRRFCPPASSTAHGT